jgi:WD40 repeat protein
MALIAEGNRAIEVRQLPSFTLDKTIARESSSQTLSLSPDGRSLAVHHDQAIDLVDLESGRVTGELRCPSYAYVLEFSPDGQRLAAACRDARIRLYDLTQATGKDPIAPTDVLEGHAAMVVGATWHPSEPLLASTSMDGKSLLWDLRSLQPLLELDQKCTRFSRDGQWLGIEGGRMRVDLSESHREFSQTDSPVVTPVDVGFYTRGKVTSEIDYWVTLAGTRLAIGQNYFRAVFRDLASDETLADVPIPGCWFRFDSRGSRLYASSQSMGFCRLPLTQREDDNEFVIEIGPPEVVHPARGGAFAIAGERVVLTPFLSSGYLLATDSWKRLSQLQVHPYTFWCDLSPDGRLAASGAMKASDVRIFDAPSGRQLHTLDSDSAAPWFSPDGRLLVVAEVARFTFYETENWQPVHRIETVSGGIWPGSLAFSDDGKLMAVEMGHDIQLINTADFSPIATFSVPANEVIESVRFSSDMRYLISGGGDQNLTHLWDLAVVRTRLRELDLDWAPDEPLPQLDQPIKPIRLKLDLGELTDPPTGSIWLQ